MIKRSSLDDPDVELEPEVKEPEPQSQILVRTRKNNIATTMPFDRGTTHIDFVSPDGYITNVTMGVRGELHIISTYRHIAIEPRSSKYIVIKPT